MNRKTTNMILVLLVISIPLFLYMFNFRLIFSDDTFYEQEFEKLGVYARFGKQETDEFNMQLLDYLDTGSDPGDILDAEEKDHMLDVRNVIRNFLSFSDILGIIILLLFSALVFSGDIKHLSFALVSGGALTLILGLLLVVSFGFNFSSSFDLFHRALFEPGTWTFPGDSVLVNIYPSGFFLDFANQVFLNTTLQAVGLVFIGLSMLMFLFSRKIAEKEKYLNKTLKKVGKKR